MKGIELSGNYENGPWSVFGNLAWSEAKGTNINSAQFNFDPAELAFISRNWIYLDHNQSWTGSAGAVLHLQPEHRLGDADHRPTWSTATACARPS